MSRQSNVTTMFRGNLPGTSLLKMFVDTLLFGDIALSYRVAPSY
jgi:hypothetical protein